MGKTRNLLKALGRIARRPALLNRVLETADEHREAVSARYGLPQGLPFTDPQHIVASLDGEVKPYAFLEGGSLPTDLALLKALARDRPGCSYFEIGTWRGESVANVAMHAGTCLTLDLPAEELRRRGAAPAYIAQQGLFCAGLPNVVRLFGDSRRMDLSDHHGRYDIVFVDGDHHYDSVLSDTRTAFRLLRDDHSVIVWHDAGHQPTDQRWEVVRGILDGCPPQGRPLLRRVAHTLCAVYTARALPELPPGDQARPRRTFGLHLRSEPLP
ncbi:MAG: class I SAM-dependent methyltransferase [Flavobacteriales bacterium]|jgi:predicted O-methyltransferase YrrM|nr:class I SAM-dependent methyltransferase [Flavobacteriales bacterium]